MNKKKIIIFIVTLSIALIIIPVIVSATREKVQLPELNEQIIEEANQKERERLLAEKKQFEEEHKNSTGSVEQFTYSIESSSERDEEIDKARDEVIEKQNKRAEIISRYYPNEYSKINSKIIEENKNEDFFATYSTLSANRKELYNLILKILEEEELTADDENVLKSYIVENMYDIKKDEDLYTRANNLVN